jgi:hypothetical protein
MAHARCKATRAPTHMLTPTRPGTHAHTPSPFPARAHTHTHRHKYTYCLSTAKIPSRTHLDITLYIHCLSCSCFLSYLKSVHSTRRVNTFLLQEKLPQNNFTLRYRVKISKINCFECISAAHVKHRSNYIIRIKKL